MKPADHTATIEAIADSIDRCPLDVLEFFLERSAIREYDGGMSRTDAEAEAVRDCLRHFAPSPSSTATLARATSAQGAEGGNGAPDGESCNHGQITHAWSSP